MTKVGTALMPARCAWRSSSGSHGGLVAGQSVARAILCHPHGARDLDEDVGRADVRPVHPVGAEQAVGQELLQFSAVRERRGHQPVRREGVRPQALLGQVAAGQPFGGHHVGQSGVHRRHRRRVVLGLEIRARVNALEGDGGVEFEGPVAPRHRGRLGAQLSQCCSPALRADIAPRSHDIRPDHDIDHGLSPLASRYSG